MSGTEVTLIDGRSGAGKTALAARLAAETGARVIHMDDLYAGWHGLATGSRLLERAILAPLAAGSPAVWRRWDWAVGDWGDEDRAEPGAPLIVEGCGSLTIASREHASRAIWLEAPEEVRHARALERDGDDSWWALWREQEDTHIAANDPASLADEVRAT
ncbi:isopentenyl transferase family protein [Agrococcus carbonis]|uniref:AAA domain-containing protein n=1 Tax=Agrococcus carbonis TaxID=684552 RepID=A0A1H1L4Z7_9MICO|nr:isopentenyl transferase family protein [Agrococcus carbonis]SDR69651.1 AAA domain-containing protein [Agrococcus carbonis]